MASLAKMAHDAEEADDDLTFLAINDEVDRRDAELPLIIWPASGSRSYQTVNQDRFGEAYITEWRRRMAASAALAPRPAETETSKVD